MMVSMRALAVLVLLHACSEAAGQRDASTSFDAAQPSLLLDPEVLLDFGEVSVQLEVMREATVTASDDVLVIESIVLGAGSPDKWRFEADAILFEGLAPGESAQIRIYFRPCPEAWIGDAIDPAFDPALCYGKVAAGALQLESNGGRRSLSLAGRGAEPPPILRTVPDQTLYFRWEAAFPGVSWVWLNVSNAGHAPLRIEEIEIVQDQEVWYLEGCSTPCVPNVTICDGDCDLPVLSLPISFYPPADFYGELIIRSNDPVMPEVSATLEAFQHPCPYPSARIDPSFIWVERDTVVRLDSYRSIPGGGETLASYRWSWVYSSTTAPELSNSDQLVVDFTPQVPGTYVLGLDVQNNCGEWTASPAVAYVLVE